MERLVTWMCETFDDVVGDRLVVLLLLIAAVLVLTGVIPGFWREA